MLGRKIRMLSLFSGIGSPETAIKNLGYDLEVVNFCEIDKFAATSYSALHHEDIENNLVDVTQVDATNFTNIDILFHGSPCQTFSNLGDKTGGDKDSGTKSSLMWETVRIVSECKPKIVIWENVTAVLNKRNRKNFEDYLSELEALGYTSSYEAISPRDIGEVQSRPRVFVVSVLNANKPFEFAIEKTDDFKRIASILEPQVDERYILQKPQGLTLAKGHKSFTGTMKVLKHDDGAYCLVAKGGKAARTNNFILYNKSDYDLQNVYKDLNDVVTILENNIPIRALTPLEYWRLQGFTDEQFYIAQKALADTYKKGNLMAADAQLYKQAGNSIHVKVLESFIGKVLEEHL